MLNIYIRERLLELLLLSYPELYNKYKGFVVETVPKETKKSSKYTFHEKKVSISTLSRHPEDIFISAIIEMAHHIDVINRQETHDDIEYFSIMKKLLTEAVNSNIINLKALNEYTDITFKNKIQKIYHKFEHWKFDVQIQPKFIYIYAFDSFMIKNILKTNGYRYDPNQNVWMKKIPYSLALEENEFTDRYQAQAFFKIIADNSFYVRPVYLIKLKTFSIQDKELLKAFDYRYEPTKKLWTKIIVAEDYMQEIKNVERIPKQSIMIAKNL